MDFLVLGRGVGETEDTLASRAYTPPSRTSSAVTTPRITRSVTGERPEIDEHLRGLDAAEELR